MDIIKSRMLNKNAADNEQNNGSDYDHQDKCPKNDHEDPLNFLQSNVTMSFKNVERQQEKEKKGNDCLFICP